MQILTSKILDGGLSDEVLKNLYGGAERKMLWSCQADPRFMYYAYVPDSISEVKASAYPVIIFIHGTGGFYPDVINRALEKFAKKNKCCVLAPLFPGGIIDKNDFSNYKVINYYGIRYDQILLSMVSEMADRYKNIAQDSLFMFGHSGGGQFVQRFLYLHPEKLKAVVISAPGRITYLDKKTVFPWGIKDWSKIFDKNINEKLLQQVPVKLLVGEKDVKFIGDFPAGKNRVERLKKLYNDFIVHKIHTEFCVIPGVEHIDGDKERVTQACVWFEKFIGK